MPWFDWPALPAAEYLRASWFDAPTKAGRQSIRADIQRLAPNGVLFVPLGSHTSHAALRAILANRFALFWNLR